MKEAVAINKKLRAKRRIEKDKARKENKKNEQLAQYTYEKVFTYQHFVEVIRKCMKGVKWKYSVQNFRTHPISRAYYFYQCVKEGKLPKRRPIKQVIIRERGKERIITPIHIEERIVQKVLCDYCLNPVVKDKLIYDNGASLKGKGTDFSRRRVMKHLMAAISEYGTDFYALSFDFKSYFDSVPHKTCRMMLERYFEPRIVDITMKIIKQYKEYEISKNWEERAEMLRKLNNDELCGMCLGSQVSQTMALLVPNDLDHYIKDTCGVKHYVRYMDDGIIFAKTKEELKELYEGMKEICEQLGLHFNEKKTHIVPVRKGFTFLKVIYSVTDTGKIVKRLTRKGIVRMRRKLKKFKPKVDRGEMTMKNVYDSYQSWREHSRVANSYHTRKNMEKLYKDLFGVKEV